MFDSLFSGFVLFGALLAVTIAILIWQKASNHQSANRFLSVCLVTSAFTYSIYGLLYVSPELSHQFTQLFFVPLATELFILPPCYLYIRKLYQIEGEPLKQKIWWHYIAPVTGTLILIPVFFSKERQLHVINTWFDSTYSQTMDISVYLVGLILLSQLIGYFILNVHAYIKYRRYIKDIFSDLETIKLGWVKGIIIIWAWYLCIHLFVFFGPIFLQAEAFESFVYQFIGINVAFYLYIAIQALSHSYIFSPHIVEVAREYAKDLSKYARSPLTEEQKDTIQMTLLAVMEDNKPYLEADLTIHQLARQLEVANSKQLSQFLNEVMSESFYQLVNRYRVEEAKRLLTAKPHFSMIDIAFEAGFKSASTFYSHFKKHTGTTPSEYVLFYSLPTSGEG